MSTAWRLASAIALVLAVDQLVGTAHGRTLTANAPAPGPDAAAVNATAAGSSASTSGASYITIEQFPPPSTAYRCAASSYSPAALRCHAICIGRKIIGSSEPVRPRAKHEEL